MIDHSILLAVIAFASALPPFWLSWRLAQHHRRALRRRRTGYRPKVTVIVPCKGGDLTFERNISSLLQQDYPDFEIIFVTATADDPAASILRKLMAQHRGPARLEVAGLHSGRGEKMTNMLHGVSLARFDSEVFVFLDGDVFLHPEFLKAIVDPLADPGVGSVCGYHQFVPTTGRVGSLLRTEWGVGGLLLLPDARRNFSIGAATALTRKVFVEAGIKDRLACAISDSFSFTNGVRSLGLRVYFEPQCLFLSFDDSSIKDTLAWSHRLIIISRNYSRPLWRMTVASFAPTSAISIMGLSLAILGYGSMFLVAPLTVMGLQMAHAGVTLVILGRMMAENYPGVFERLLQWRLRLILLAPLTPYVVFLNVINSLLTREFVWRGTHYRIHGESRVEVIGRDVKV